MSAVQWLVIGWLALSGLVVFGRGCAGSTRTYTLSEGIWGLAEVAVLIYLVAVVL